MNVIEFGQALPPRLRRALWIWLALTPLVALLPQGANEAIGISAHPVFWCALLPTLSLLPYARPLLLRTLTTAASRSRRRGAQARRRSRIRMGLRQAA